MAGAGPAWAESDALVFISKRVRSLPRYARLYDLRHLHASTVLFAGVCTRALLLLQFKLVPYPLPERFLAGVALFASLAHVGRLAGQPASRVRS
jgi:hypothetical protein